jgi:hypothetical protein
VPNVTVITPNLNGQSHLPGLIEHLARQTQPDFLWLLVDNGSSDDSVSLVEGLCQTLPIRLHVIRNAENRGFAAACNQGIAASQSPWIALLNNDTLPEPGWLEALLTTTIQGAKVGMAASKMLFAHNRQQINSAGIALDPLGIAWDWRGGMLDAAEERQIVEVFGPCGGAGLYSRTMLDEIGYFDEDFFVYLEDVDLAWRARLAGWRCLFQPQARVYHAHSATLGQSSPLKRFWLGRNKVWLIAKNYPAPDLWRNLFWIIGYDLLAISYGVLSRGDLASLRGRWAGLRGLPRMLRKRKQLHQGALDLENWRRTLGPIESPLAIRSRYQHL